MKCLNCSHDNAPDSMFCENCGKPLERACPNCGKPIAANAKFCKYCGAKTDAPPVPAPARVADSPQNLVDQYMPKEIASKIAAARDSGTVVGERRIVTILFADIKGSTAMAEKLDPEEWAEIMNRAFKFLIEPVYRYEGTVARLMGDAILAFFGAPITHEDDPQRAVLAALDILEGMTEYRAKLKKDRDLDFGVRIGLNTGLVVVGNIGSDLKFEYTAMGDAINLASRMQTATEPNTILVSENTARGVRHAFDLESRGALELKGKSEPVPAFRVLARKAAPESARGIAGLDSPLVGREREFTTLKTCIDELIKGRGQIVSVMGEAGLGKSRLIAEIRKQYAVSSRQSSENQKSEIRNLKWFEGRSLSYQTTTPYAPFIDLLTKQLDLRAEDNDADKYAKITTRAGDDAPFLATMLGVKFEGADVERVKYLEPPQLRGAIFQAVRAFVEQLATTAPLVWLFEDLHWADATSLDLIEQLMPLTETKSLLLIALFRPQRQEPSWRFHELAARDYAHRYTQVLLEPLDEKQSRTLVGNLLHIEDLPDHVRALILKKAEGNPFFVEEVIRSLLDSKLVVRQDDHWRATREIETIAIPDTLAGVIGARLDRLDDESKHAAQTAAVIGREFQHAILADISDAPAAVDASMLNLQKREIVREKSRAPEIVYFFKHALTQEAAYASILLSKRRALHKRVAECLEKLDRERVNDIARHFIEAQENARALPYLVQAGGRALREYSTQEAITYFSRAAQIAETSQDTALARAAFEGLGGALLLTADAPRALQNFESMMQYAQLHQDVPMLVSAHNKLAYVAMFSANFENVEKHLRQAEQLARSVQDKPGLSEMFIIRCQICTASGDFETAIKYVGESAQLGQALGRQEQVAYGMTHTANALMFLTRYDEALVKANQALAMSEQIGDRAHQAELLTLTFPPLYLRNGDFDTARKLAVQGTEIGERIGSTMATTFGYWVQGIIARLRGEYQDAVDHFEQSLSAAKTGMPMFLVLPLGSLGTTLLEISPQFADKSMALHTEALKLMEHPVPASMGGVGWAEIGFCALGLEDAEKADELFQKGLNYPTTQGLMYKAVHLIGSAHVALAQKRFDAAAKLVQEARVYVEERKMQHHYPDIALADARVSAARGETERALDQFDHAEKFALVMNMRPIIWQARAGAAKVFDTLNRKDEANAKHREARAMIDEIAALFRDAKMRGLFFENATQRLNLKT